MPNWLTFQLDYLIFTVFIISIGFILSKVANKIFFSISGAKVSRKNNEVLVTSIVIGLIFGWVIGEYKGRVADQHIRDNLIFQAEVIASTINQDRLELLKFTEDDLKNPAYLRIHRQLRLYSSHVKELRGIYTIIKKDGKLVFGPEDYDFDDPMASRPGQVYEMPDKDLYDSFKDGQKRVSGPVRDEYGTFISAYAPVFSNLTGQVRMIVGVDILADKWENEIKKVRRSSIANTAMMLFFFFIFYILLAVRDAFGLNNRLLFKQLEAFFILFIGTMLALLLSMTAYDYSMKSADDDFKNLALAKSKFFKQELFELRKGMEGMAGFIALSDINAGVFSKAAQPVAKSPLVSGVQYIKFSDGKDAFTGSIEGSLKAEYSFPFQDKYIFHNLDHLADVDRRKAIETAFSTSMTTSTRPLHLVKDKESGMFVFVYTPVYSQKYGKVIGIVASIVTLTGKMAGTYYSAEMTQRDFRLDLIMLSEETPVILNSCNPDRCKEYSVES